MKNIITTAVEIFVQFLCLISIFVIVEANFQLSIFRFVGAGLILSVFLSVEKKQWKRGLK